MSTPARDLHQIHGLVVESDLALEGATVRSGAPIDGGPPRYRVVEGATRSCPSEPPRGDVLAERRVDDLAHWTSVDPQDPSRWTIRFAGVCDAVLDLGRREITVHRDPVADEGLVGILLGGSVLAYAAMAEGRLVLHASAVAAGERALVIAGASGSGKSTLAALLCAAGCELIADDALRLDPAPHGAICFPGSRAIRLRAGAARLAERIEGADVRATADGRVAVLPSATETLLRPVAAVILPSPSRDVRRLALKRLAAMDAVIELLRNPRLTSWRAPGPVARLFELTAAVADGVAVYRATIPWGPPFPPALAMDILSRREIAMMPVAS